MSKLVSFPAVVIDVAEYLPKKILDEQKIADIAGVLAEMLLRVGNSPLGFGADFDTLQIMLFFTKHEDAKLATKFAHRAMEALGKGWKASEVAINEMLAHKKGRPSPLWGDLYQDDEVEFDDDDDPEPEGIRP